MPLLASLATLEDFHPRRALAKRRARRRHASYTFESQHSSFPDFLQRPSSRPVRVEVQVLVMKSFQLHPMRDGKRGDAERAEVCVKRPLFVWIDG